MSKSKVASRNVVPAKKLAVKKVLAKPESKVIKKTKSSPVVEKVDKKASQKTQLKSNATVKTS